MNDFTPQQKKDSKRKKFIIGIFILLLFSFSINIAQALHVFDNNPTVKVVTSDDIKQSNELLTSKDFTPEKFSTFVEKEIKTKTNWEKDPNAVYMDYLAQSFQSNELEMKNAYEKLSKMNELGYFVDGRFFPLKNLELMQNEIEASTHESSENKGRG